MKTEISGCAVEAVQYAAGSGLMKGKSALNPKDNAARAEIVTTIHRFVEGNKYAIKPVTGIPFAVCP